MTASSPSTNLNGVDAVSVQIDLASVAIVTVTYNPDPEILELQLSQLPPASLKVIVDNASCPDVRVDVQRVAARHSAVLFQNDVNLGLAAALNQGARHAQQVRPFCQFLLLLDQDTEPGSDGVERLVASYDRTASSFGKACCIGPRLVDTATKLEHGFHQIRGFRWSRIFPPLESHTSIRLANLNGSGTLMPIALFNELGGLEEDLFIDHIDTEWAFRVLAAGYGLYGIPDVKFSHRMGERSLRFWFLRWRVWPDRSPQRHYYLFRNAVRLIHRGYVPIVWKVWAVVKLIMTLTIHAVFDSSRCLQVRYMVRGAREGTLKEKFGGGQPNPP